MKRAYIFSLLLLSTLFTYTMDRVNPEEEPLLFRGTKVSESPMASARQPQGPLCYLEREEEKKEENEQFDLGNFFKIFGAAAKDISGGLWNYWVASPARKSMGAAGDELVRAAMGAIEKESQLDGTLHKSIQNFLQLSAQQFEEEGEGRQAINNITQSVIVTFFESLAQHMEAPAVGAGAEGNAGGRAIRHALQAMLTMFEQEFNRGGFERLTREFLEMWNRHMQGEGPIARILQTINDQVGQVREQLESNVKKLSDTLDEKVKQVSEHVEKGVHKIGVEANEQAEALGKKVEEVGAHVEKRYERMKWSGIKGVAFGAGLVGTAWYGSHFLWSEIERYFSRPRLVADSSRKTPWQQFKNYFWPEQLHFREMIFSKELKRELDDIVAITKHVSQQVQKGITNVRYLNVLLWGPPGTGKTMFAEELAKKSGLDFAIMSGASFSKFSEREGIEAMDKLFNWAQTSKKGLIIFIDEAESFLAHREKSNTGTQDADTHSKEYKFITNFLSKTGQGSNKFMLIFATNKPELLDSAVRRRVHRELQVGLPEKPERAKVLRLYRDKLLLDKDQNTPEFMESVKTYLSDTVIDRIAERTKGLAASELEDIINDLKVSADITDSHLVSAEVVDYVVSRMLKKHNEFGKHFNHAAPAA